MNNFDDTTNNTELASTETTPTAKGAFDDIFPNEQEEIQPPPQQAKGLFDGIAGAGANKYQRTGIFDDIVVQSNIESDLKRQEQLRQEQQEKLAQQQKYAWIDDVVNSPLSWISLTVIIILFAKRLFKSLRKTFYWFYYETFDKEHFEVLRLCENDQPHIHETYFEHTRRLCKEFESHALGSIFPIYMATAFLTGFLFMFLNNKGATGITISVIGFWLAYIPIYIVSKMETNRFLRKLIYNELTGNKDMIERFNEEIETLCAKDKEE